MKLFMDNTTPAEVRKPLEREFEKIVGEMKLTNSTYCVRLDFFVAPPQQTGSNSSGYLGGQTEGPEPGSHVIRVTLNMYTWLYKLDLPKKVSDTAAFDFIRSFRHEMGHVWQHATEKLVIRGRSRFWNGEDYTYAPVYEDQPWEVEARAFEMHFTRKENPNAQPSY